MIFVDTDRHRPPDDEGTTLTRTATNTTSMYQWHQGWKRALAVAGWIPTNQPTTLARYTPVSKQQSPDTSQQAQQEQAQQCKTTKQTLRPLSPRLLHLAILPSGRRRRHHTDPRVAPATLSFGCRSVDCRSVDCRSVCQSVCLCICVWQTTTSCCPPPPDSEQANERASKQTSEAVVAFFGLCKLRGPHDCHRYSCRRWCDDRMRMLMRRTSGACCIIAP